MSLQSRDIKNIVIAMSLVVTVGLFVVVLLKRQGDGILTIKYGDSEMQMNFSDNRVELKNIVDMAFGNELKKREAIAMFREFYNLYERDSQHLMDSYRRETSDSELSRSMRELLFDLKGPFRREHHTYHDITKPSIIDALVELGYDHPASERLRELRDQAEGMFKPRGIEANIFFYQDDATSDGQAAVCEGSKYRGRNLLIINPNNQTTIEVFVRSIPFQCIMIKDEDRDTQIILINYKDGKKLFGDVNFRRKERAFIYPAPQGYANTPPPHIFGISESQASTQ